MNQPIDPAKLEKVARGLLSGLTPAQLQEMADLYARRYSAKKIGDQFGVGADTVCKLLRRMGVTLRRPGAQTVSAPRSKPKCGACWMPATPERPSVRLSGFPLEQLAMP